MKERFDLAVVGSGFAGSLKVFVVQNASLSDVEVGMSGLIVLMTLVLLSTLLRFWQEYRSNKAAEELKAMVRSTTAVLRAGAERAQEIPISELVPGDIVMLAAGDMIPADVRVLSAKDLFVSQAMLTGESIPVEKHGAQLARPAAADAQRGALDLETVCFMGSNVVSGTATAVVVGSLRYPAWSTSVSGCWLLVGI